MLASGEYELTALEEECSVMELPLQILRIYFKTLLVLSLVDLRLMKVKTLKQ